MKNLIQIIGSTALGLACLAGTAHAELVLTGSTAGYFQGASSGSTLITNAADGQTASFRTGVPIAGQTLKSGVQFDAVDFTGIHSGDSFGLGFLTYFNGRTKIGTSSATADLDFWLNLDNPSIAPFKLTTITFGLDATANTNGSPQPDVFTATFTQPPKFKVGGQWVQFTINSLPAEWEVKESSWAKIADITVTFTPVPEPATYGLMASAGLLGFASYRRFRGRKGGAAHA